MGDSERAAAPRESGDAAAVEQAARVGRGAVGDEPAKREGFGSLVLERTHKDDGRLLIYYTASEATS